MTTSTATVLVAPSVERNPQASGTTRQLRASRLSDADALALFRVRNNDADSWDHEKFRDYVMVAARRLGMQKPADIARATNVTGGQLSKWLRGVEQPNVPSLQKLATALKVSRLELYALAGRFSQDDLDLTAAPEVPDEPDPLVMEITAMLSDTSPLGEERRDTLRTVLDAVLMSYRGDMRRRRIA